MAEDVKTIGADAPSPKGRPKVDWEAVHAEYESGQFSVREIARRAGVDHALVSRRIKKEGWVKGGIEMAKRRRVAEKMLVTGDNVTTQVTNGDPQRHAAAIEAAAEKDAAFMLRVARAAEASVRNSERILAVANEALDKSGTMDWAERSETIKEGDGETNGNSTTTTTKTAGKFDLAFDAGKCTKIATEALQIARKTYALARGLEDGTEGVNVNVQANAQAGAQAQVATDVDARMVFFRASAARSVEKLLTAESAQGDAAASTLLRPVDDGGRPT